MQEISSSLRQRLAAKPQPQEHPDADLLTAYVEQLLTPSERGRIMQHLADCSYCREVLSLSLPEPQELPAAPQLARRSRWWIPGYQWAALAATVAIAATLVIEKPWQSRVHPFVSHPAAEQNRPSTANLQPSPATPPAPSSAPSAAEPVANPSLAFPARDERLAEPARKSLSEGEKLADHEAVLRKGPAERGVGGVVQAAPSFALQDSRASAPKAAPSQPGSLGLAGRVSNGNSASADMLKSADILKEEKAQASQTTEVAASAANVEPPPAPAPKITNGAGEVRSFTPALTAENTRDTLGINIVPPQTTATSSAPTADDSNLAKSGGFALKSKMSSAISKTITAVKKAGGAKSSTTSTFSASSMAAPAPPPAEADPGYRRQLAPQVHWSITPDGRLVKSTDQSQWHDAYPQGPDLQFRVVVAEGRQIWAGGNHATLIHSWNGGVNWETLKVPDAASDITQISIDEDWQVKTSNGQTFVSTDHGQTWTPLQQDQPK